MRKVFAPLLVIAAAMFAYAPVAINNAPYQSTMLLIQKIFYFHVGSWVALACGLAVCGIASLIYLFNGTPEADRYANAGAELTALFGLFGLASGMLWARKAWGIWWEWDARLTMAFMLELIFAGYLLVRKFGGPGAEKLAAGMGIFGAATAPFIYKSVDWWRTIHPKTSVIRSLDSPDSSPAMAHVLYFCMVAFVLLFCVLLALRVRLESERAALDELYLLEEE